MTCEDGEENKNCSTDSEEYSDSNPESDNVRKA